ncbi:hypothetical protein ACFQZQ_09930 [Lysobacter koreensis]|uniref:Lipoprotein n=1 Tax=Lysobacter koreensis TaxID=266122 RepID=A0ABW2YSS8_9GAMM
MTLTLRTALALLAAIALLGGCERGRVPEAASGRRAEPGATEPTQAVARLVDDLRRNDLAGYARHAVPPALHAQLEIAWAQGRTRWPLTELPLDDRLPGFLAALATPGSERALLATYDRQFAGAHGELRSAAATLGLFGVQYLRAESDYSDDERNHYVQLVGALSQWGKRAPLGDPKRARSAIPLLAAAARRTGLAGEGGFARTGMTRSLQRLGPFFASFKQVLVGYGLDVDAALAGAEVTVAEQDGNRAKVRLRYTLAGQRIDALVRVERLQGRWYLSDALRHAQVEARGPAPAATP